MSDPIMKIQVLTRSEMALATMRAQRAVRRSAVLAVAVLVGLVGLVMLDVSAFHALSVRWGPAGAALIMAVINLVAAGIAVLIAHNVGPKESEEKLAIEMRDLAQKEIQNDIDQVKAELAQITAGVRAIHASISAFSNVSANIVAPLMGGLIKRSKKR